MERGSERGVREASPALTPAESNAKLWERGELGDSATYEVVLEKRLPFHLRYQPASSSALCERSASYLTHTLADIIQHPQVSTASSFSAAAALALAAATFTPTPTAVSAATANDRGGQQPGRGV